MKNDPHQRHYENGLAAFFGMLIAGMFGSRRAHHCTHTAPLADPSPTEQEEEPSAMEEMGILATYFDELE